MAGGARGPQLSQTLGRTHASRPPSIPRRSTMAKYPISFPSAAMVVPDGEWGAVGRDAHAVIDEAKAAGVYVFGGGIEEDVPVPTEKSTRVASDTETTALVAQPTAGQAKTSRIG